MPRNLKVSPGSHFPLGATVTKGGVNFALFSQNASEVCMPFTPPLGAGTSLSRLVDTALHSGEDVMVGGFPLPRGQGSPFRYLVSPRSAVVLVEHK